MNAPTSRNTNPIAETMPPTAALEIFFEPDGTLVPKQLDVHELEDAAVDADPVEEVVVGPVELNIVAVLIGVGVKPRILSVHLWPCASRAAKVGSNVSS